MFPVTNILNRVFVTQFYKQNTGLLLFIFFVMFGMVEGSQLVYYHLSLMTGIVQSTSFLGLVLLIWTAYGVKSSQFVLALLAKPQNSFLFGLASLPRGSQLLNLFMTHLLIHLPVWIYALATSIVAVKQARPTIGLLIVGFNLVICLVASWLSVRKLNHPSSFHVPFLASIKLPFRKPLFWFYLGFIMNEALLILVITKLFSFFALFGFFQIPLDHYENRIPLMGLLIGMVAHAVLVYEVRKWEDNYLSFVRNLPMKLSARFFVLAILYALLITPEIFLLVTNHVQLLDIMTTIAFGVSLLLFLHAMLYQLNMNMDKYIQFVLITFLLGFALILFKLSLLLILVHFTLSSLWYRKYFYSFEATW